MLRTRALTKVYSPPAGLRRMLMRAPVREPIVAVDHVDISAAPGEVFGLLGPNGAGKTTLIKMLTTLLRPTSGSASLAGLDVVSDEQKVRRRIGIVTGDERSFYWRLTGRQNLAFFASLAGLSGPAASARVSGLLAQMGLVEHSDNMFYSYSSGMRQRLGIARALLSSPSVLFLDEPTKNVDPLTAADLRRLIQRLSKEQGATVLLATHRLEEAEQLCDKLAIMHKGRVVFFGTLSDLRKQVGGRDRFTLLLQGIDSGRCRQLALSRRLLDVDVERPGNDGLVKLGFSLRDGHAQLSGVLGDVLSCGGDVLSFDRRERRLEEMFSDVLEGRASG